MPFGLICFSIGTVWYALHGHAPEDVTGHRTRARWYTTKTEPSYDDMTIKLRRFIIAAQISQPMPLSRPPDKKLGPSSQPGRQWEHDQQNGETREVEGALLGRGWCADLVEGSTQLPGSWQSTQVRVDRLSRLDADASVDGLDAAGAGDDGAQLEFGDLVQVVDHSGDPQQHVP